MTFQQKAKKQAGIESSEQAQPEAPSALTPAVMGPLSRTVERARLSRRGAKQDWGAVAQQVTAQYHALGTQANQQDLLAALRRIPDQGARDSLMTTLAGPDAEGLRLAVSGAVPKASAWQKPTMRAKFPSNPLNKSLPSSSSRPSLPSPAKGDATSARVAQAKKPLPTAATSQGGAQKAASHQPSVSQSAAKSSGARGKLEAKPKASSAKAATQAGAQAKEQGKEGQKAAAGGKDLKVVNAALFAGLDVPLKPTWQRGDKLVFEGSAWHKAQEQVQRALAAKQAQNSVKPSGKPQGATEAMQATAQAKAPSKKPKQALKIPSATISASEIKRHEQQNRKKNSQKLSSLVARARKARAGIAKVSAKATPLITAAQRSAEAQVSAALKQSLSQIGSAEQAAKANVTSRAAQATAAVNAAYATTTQGIRQDTTKKIADLKREAQTLKSKLIAGKAQLSAGVRQEFTHTQTAMRGIGNQVAAQARQMGEAEAGRYAKEPIPEQNALQELANGGDYYKNKHKAKVEAARKTGNEYGNGMTKAGSDQAAQLMTSLPDALKSHDTVLKEYQTTADKYVAGQVTALQAQQTSALQAASTQRTALLSQISQQRASALSGIASAAAKGRSGAQAQAQQARGSIAKQAQGAKAGVTRGVLQAGKQMDGRIRDFEHAAKGQLNQDHADFVRGIAGFEKYAATGATAAQSGILSSAKTGAGRVKASGAPAAKGIGSLGRSTASSLKAQGNQSGASLTALGKSGQTGLKAVLSGHTKATQASLSAAKTQLGKFDTGFTQDAAKLLGDTKKQLKDSENPFREALTHVLTQGNGETKAELPAIREAAEAAADAVKPRWKAWASVLIDVVIMVGTIAAIAALTAVLGPVGLVLAGMAIGALGQVVGQALKDGIDGKFSGWRQYGMVAVAGAIGGAFGGAGGLVGGALSKGLAAGLVRQGIGKAGQFVAKVGIESAVGTGFDLAGQVATGYTNQAVFNEPFKLGTVLNAANIGKTIFTNSAGTFLAQPSTLKFVGSKLSNMNIPGKGLVGQFQNRMGKLQTSLAESRPMGAIGKLDSKIMDSKLWQKSMGGLEKGGEKLGDMSGKAYKNAESGYIKAGDALERNPVFYKLREQFRTATDPRAFRDAVAHSQSDIDAAIQKIPDPEVRRAIQEQVDWIEANPHLFTSGKDKGMFYSGAKDGVSNGKLAGEYHDANPSRSTRIDDTAGGKHLEGLDLYVKYSGNTEWADIVWKKASQIYARNVRGNINEFVDGANPARVYHQTEKPILDTHPRVTGRSPHENLGNPDLHAPPVQSMGHGPYFDPKVAGGLQAMMEGGHGGLPTLPVSEGVGAKGSAASSPEPMPASHSPEPRQPAPAQQQQAEAAAPKAATDKASSEAAAQEASAKEAAAKEAEAKADDKSDPDHLSEDDLRETKEHVEKNLKPEGGDLKPNERLEALGLTKAGLTGLAKEELEALNKSAEGWNTNADGRSQGVIHTQDYAQGKGGSGKQNRLLKLSEYTGRGSFDADDPLLLQKVTHLLEEITTSPALPPRVVGEKEIYFIAKDGAQPPYSASQKGIIVIKFQDKFATFMNGNYKSYERME